MSRNEIVVNNIQELLSVLKKEADKKARFPALFIHVGKLSSWNTLLKWFSIEAKIVRLSKFCKGEDVTPFLPIDEVKRLINESSENVVIVPVSEWLRLIDTSKEFVQGLAQIEAPQASRLFIPLFSCDILLEKSLAALARWNAGESVKLIKLEEHIELPSITIIPNVSTRLFHKVRLLTGLKSYFSFWEFQREFSSVVLKTRFASVLTSHNLE